MKIGAFTLAEVVISVGILGGVLLVLMGLVITASSGASSNYESELAIAVAEAEIDRWKRQDFPALVAGIGLNSSVVMADGREHRITTEIERLDTAPGSDDFDVLRVVSVVNWDSRTVEPTSRERVGRVRLETQVCASARY